MKFWGLPRPPPHPGKDSSVPTQLQGSGSPVSGNKRKFNFLNQKSQEMARPEDEGRAGQWHLPLPHSGSPGNAPPAPSPPGAGGGMRIGAPRLASPLPPPRPPPAAGMQLLYCFPLWDSSSPAPPPPHLPSPAPSQFPNPAPPLPFGKPVEGRVPKIPSAQSGPSPALPPPLAQGCWSRGGCGSRLTPPDEFCTPTTRAPTHALEHVSR